MKQRIAIVIPCNNEELTIRSLVSDFKATLPEAQIHVFDNCSTDRTRDEALTAGAHVHYVSSLGKGVVVTNMFRAVEADIYVMVDGDNTYPPEYVLDLIRPIIDREAEMVVGTRLDRHRKRSFRPLHIFGNKLVVGLINVLFGAKLTDVL